MASEQLSDVLELLKQWGEASGMTSDRLDIGALRDVMENGVLPLPDTAEARAVNAASVPAKWILEAGVDTDRRLLYLHGGGYIAGGLTSHRALASWIGKSTGCAVLLADYRLAPEHPFPAAVEDAASAFDWMMANGPDGEAPASRAFVGGDSAGGALTLATMLRLRDQESVLPHAAFTISAYADLAFSGRSITTRADVDPMLKPPVLPAMAAAYLRGADARNPLASPVYADPAGLPPLLMQVGDAEILLDDTTRFAAKAEEAGVDVTMEVWPEMFHVWHGFAPMLPEGQQAIDRIGEFLRAH